MKENFKTEYKASVKIDPTSEPYLPHNDRTDNKAKNIYTDMSHLNEYHIFSDNNESVKDMHERLYQEAKDTYMAKSKRKDKFTDKKATLVEAIYELTPETSKEQVIKLTQEIAKITGFTPLHIAIHKDEGHITENCTFQKHYHAHAVFFTLDKESGKQLKRLSLRAQNKDDNRGLTKDNLAKMQDLAVEHLSTTNYKMVRGEERHKHNKEVDERGGDKSEYKTKVYKHKLKDYIVEQQIQQRERQINAKANNLQAKEQDIANREYEQNIKDLEAKKVLEDFEKRLYKNDGIMKIWKKAKGQLTNSELRDLAFALTVKERESSEKQLNELQELHKQEYSQLVKQNTFLERQIAALSDEKSYKIANTKEIDKEKLEKYISKMQEKQKDLTPTFSQKLKEWD